MKKINFILAGILISLFSIAIASAQNNYGCGMMNSFYGGYGAGMMLFSWIFGLACLVALVLLIIWLIKQINKK